jgi:hypothetical protein
MTAAKWANLTAPEIFYHGGISGLHVGDFLLPPTVGGQTSMVDRVADALPNVSEAWEAYRQSDWRQRELRRVFVTKELMAAVYFASQQHPQVGDVYQVEPFGNIADTTSSSTCDRARIIAVVMEGVTFEELARRKATS